MSTIGAQATTGNAAKLLVGDNATYREALRLIDGAKDSIQLETFTFNGAQGQGITDALILAAKRGVKVQVVLDTKAMYIGGQKGLAEQLIAGGVDVREYRERNLASPLVAIDHAKILAVDGKTGLVGGTNFDRRVNYDLNFELQGPAVPQIQDMFIESWTNSAPNGDLGKTPRAEAPIVRGDGARVAGGQTTVGLSQTAAEGTANVEKTRRDALTRINTATRSIDLLMYNLDDPAEIKALVAAAKRGVKVRVILNHETGLNVFSKLKAQALNLNMAAVEAFRANGIEVHWFKLPPGTDEMHAKVAVFDGQEVLGGSTNWVHSSNYDNHELGVWLQGPIAGQVQGVFNGLWQQQSTPVPKLSWGDKLRADVAGFLSKFL